MRCAPMIARCAVPPGKDPELPATQQIALALRLVCGLPVARIAKVFLVGERAMPRPKDKMVPAHRFFGHRGWDWGAGLLDG